MSMVKQSAEIIQAFPIMPHTYVGTPNGFAERGYSILHAAEALTLTIDFGTMGSVTLDVPAGQDVALSDHYQAITATGVCWIS